MATMDDILGNGGGTPPPKGLRNGTNSSKTLLPYHPRQRVHRNGRNNKQLRLLPLPAPNLKRSLHLRPNKPMRTVAVSHTLNCTKNSIPINRQRTRNLLKKRRSRNVNRYSQPLVMVYRHSRTCSSPRSTLQICIPVRIPCQNVPK